VDAAIDIYRSNRDRVRCGFAASSGGWPPGGEFGGDSGTRAYRGTTCFRPNRAR